MKGRLEDHSSTQAARKRVLLLPPRTGKRKDSQICLDWRKGMWGAKKDSKQATPRYAGGRRRLVPYRSTRPSLMMVRLKSDRNLLGLEERDVGCKERFQASYSQICRRQKKTRSVPLHTSKLDDGSVEIIFV